MKQKTGKRSFREIVYCCAMKIIRGKNNNEVFPQEVIEALKESEEEIERGEGIPMEIAFKEMRKKYGF